MIWSRWTLAEEPEARTSDRVSKGPRPENRSQSWQTISGDHDYDDDSKVFYP